MQRQEYEFALPNPTRVHLKSYTARTHIVAFHVSSLLEVGRLKDNVETKLTALRNARAHLTQMAIQIQAHFLKSVHQTMR